MQCLGPSRSVFLRSLSTSPLVLLVFTCSVLAQEGSVATDQVESASDSLQRKDAAKLEMSRASVEPHLQHATETLSALKLDSAHSLKVSNAATDDLGYTHVRLQQYYRGLRVVNGTLISHADSKGKYLDYTDSLKRSIHIDTTPKLSESQAAEIASKIKSQPGTSTHPPKVELVVLPMMQLVNKRTGEPIKPGPHGSGPYAIPGELKAEDTESRAKEYRLAYEVRTIEIPEHGHHVTGWRHHIDANTGEVLRSVPLFSSAAHKGSGNGPNVGQVDFGTIDYHGGFRMRDSFRKFRTLDDDRSDDDPENKAVFDVWGDGQIFKGDAKASPVNRQSAMVDAMFGSTVYWDLMSNVFHRQGPDDHFYSVNVFVHVGTDWDDDEYSYTSGNISIGDGHPGKKNRQALDCLGHENGHGLQDFTVSFDGCIYNLFFPSSSSCDSGGLNESDSDIWGAMTVAYLNSGAFASKSNSIPKVDSQDNLWRSQCSGRDMEKPSSSENQSDFWFPGVGATDPHDAAAPNNRAFYFLAEGASPVMTAKNYSPLLPWGMKGLGADKAARIWFNGVVHDFSSDTDYPGAAGALFFAALVRFGPVSDEANAILNAYAGIGVTSTAANYPKPPEVKMEGNGSHHDFSTPEIVKRPTSKPAGAPADAPDKLTIFGSGAQKSDFYQVSLKNGETINVRLNGMLLSDYDLLLFHQNNHNKPIVSSRNGIGSFDIVTFNNPGPGTKDVIIEVRPFQVGIDHYLLDFDFF